MLKNLQNSIIESTQKGVDLTEEPIESVKKHVVESKYAKKLSASLNDNNSVLSRMKSQHPDFTIDKYKAVLDIILDKPIESKRRKDIKLYGNGDDDNTQNTAEAE